jgi:hypothetical protein
MKKKKFGIPFIFSEDAFKKGIYYNIIFRADWLGARDSSWGLHRKINEVAEEDGIPRFGERNLWSALGIQTFEYTDQREDWKVDLVGVHWAQ